MKAKDFQLANYLIINELDLARKTVAEFLDTDIEVYPGGEADTVARSGNSLKFNNPTSVTKFLFNLIYHVAFANEKDDELRDKCSMSLFQACHDYVYEDAEDENLSGPAVISTVDKNSTVDLVVRQLMEPMLGKAQDVKSLFVPCAFVDSCRIVDDPDYVTRMYNLDRKDIAVSGFPILVTNTNVHNKAARYAHMVTKWMELCYGFEKTKGAIKAVLLDGDSSLLDNLILILKVTWGDPEGIVDFLEYLQSNALLTEQELAKTICLQASSIEKDSYLSQHIKLATDGKYTPQVWHQWSQMSMLSGLTEKQLEGARGTDRPATRNVGPIEDDKKRLMADKAKKKKKRQLNFEEMLESDRDYYGHNAQRGKVYEHLLGNDRIWR